ncbi:hypothetical protein BDY19DRAFT_903828 [Irpex rosettiformis]|uniref:Uncharacterized protein n=1 Tax=Irpex rosettiformis TaxID=378272 RepID=A0ACB8UCN4_9APHY|nr:hypothetical protein BDY19DRAFT_903828 [Irpex rosettiformis]
MKAFFYHPITGSTATPRYPTTNPRAGYKGVHSALSFHQQRSQKSRRNLIASRIVTSSRKLTPILAKTLGLDKGAFPPCTSTTLQSFGKGHDRLADNLASDLLITLAHIETKAFALTVPLPWLGRSEARSSQKPLDAVPFAGDATHRTYIRGVMKVNRDAQSGRVGPHGELTSLFTSLGQDRLQNLAASAMALEENSTPRPPRMFAPSGFRSSASRVLLMVQYSVVGSD